MLRDIKRRETAASMMLAGVMAAALVIASCNGHGGERDYGASLLASSYFANQELPVKGDGLYVSPDAKSNLTVSGPVRVLKLSGTRSRMGYAYGYLLAAEIMNTMNRFSCWVASHRNYDYAALGDRQAYVAWDPDSLAEMQGMLDGMGDALPEGDLAVRPAGGVAHRVNLDDLKILNTLADWACSSFSVWGGGRSLDGGSTLMARNLDYYIDPGATIKRSHVIISYNPSAGTRWVNVAFCGIIGCISGMNEYGVAGIIQNTIHLPNTDASGFIPRSIALRKVLEGSDGSSTPADIEAMLEGFPNYNGCNYLFAYPSAGRTGDDIAAVMEYDGKADHPDGRVTHRKPSDNGTLPWNADYDQRVSLSYAIINTNHYLKRYSEISYVESAKRYCTIKEMLPVALGDGHVSREEGRAIMEAVGGYGTLHTVIFEPDNLFLRIYLSSGDRGAFEYPEHDFLFEELF
ncbi:MAG: hypothetical protein KA369_05600 [Spirochaetes bacterium]|nr:hypothetical protein [Spirochaetota bacterium]